MKAKTLMPKVAPINQPEWGSRQSKYPTLPEAGISNGLLVAPSFTGNTTQRSSWLLDWYRGAYARIYIFSPNAFTPEWAPVKDYIERILGVDLDEEKCLFETLDEETLSSIISTQKRVIAHQNRKNTKRCMLFASLLMTWPVNQNFIRIMEA